MARAMKLGVEAGRLAFRAGRIPRKSYASASSPLDGLIAPLRATGRAAAVSITSRLEDDAARRPERLARERDEADRRYNDALTALDRALMRAPDLPHAAAALRRPPDHAAQRVVGRVAPPSGRRRLEGTARRVRLAHRRRRRSRSRPRSTRRLVDHLNRNVAAHARAPSGRSMRPSRVLRGQLRDLLAFQSRLIVYLQQITALRRHEGSRHRRAGAGRQRRGERVCRGPRETVGVDGRARAALRGAGRGAAAAHDELRTLVGVSQQAAMAIKRELERLHRAADDRHRSSEGGRPAGSSMTGAAFSRRSLDAYKYVGFEDQFRGSQETIRAAARELPARTSTEPSDVLDVGCGRGEFLDLLAARGIARPRARPQSRNGRGLPRARPRRRPRPTSSSISTALPDGSLGGSVRRAGRRAPPAGYLLRFLELAHPQAASRRADRARDAQPGVLGRVLRQLHPRHHARLAAASRDAAVSRAGERLLRGRGSNTARRWRRRIGCRRSPRGRTALGGSRRDVQRERREAERAHVHLPRLRHRCPPLVVCIGRISTTRGLSGGA